MTLLSYRLKVGAALVATVGGLALAAGGCELIASVDRSQIPGGGGSSPSSSSASTGTGGIPKPDCDASNKDTACATKVGMNIMAGECRSYSCTNGKCDAPVDTKQGQTCGAAADNKVCDGKGSCVDKHCMDGIKDADETDVDCGGKGCAGCVNDKNCKVTGDCLSLYCQMQGGTGGAGGAGGSMMKSGICKPCAASADCDGTHWCDKQAGDPLKYVCAVQKMNGATCDPADPKQCPMNNCVDTVCCDGACGAACSACSMAKGATKDGMCTAMAVKSGPDAGACDDNKGPGAGMCAPPKKCACDAAGTCKNKQGETCAAAGDCASGFCVDGFCCNTACAGACDACSVALGALANGTCVATATKSKDRPSTCDDTHGGCANAGKCTCDANGACKEKQGETCTVVGDCASTFCADGKCCNQACGGPCAACSTVKGAATDGTCLATAVKNGDDTGACDNTHAGGSCKGVPCGCDAGGICKGKNGIGAANSATCMAGGDCLSTFCADTFCCDSACAFACNSCNLAAKEGKCSTVMSAVDTGTCDANTAAGMCNGKPCSCDAGGNCKGDAGALCAADNNCNTAGGCSTDKLCCNTVCAGKCNVCPGGACGVRMLGTQAAGVCDDAAGGCGAKCACDGTANGCKRKTGEPDGGAAANCVKGTSTGGVCD